MEKKGMEHPQCICLEPGTVMSMIYALGPDDFLEPERALGNFKLLGHKMNDFERRAFTVMRRLIDKAREMATETVPGEPPHIFSAKEVLIKQISSVQNILYTSIYDRLNLWDRYVSLSSGWEIVFPDIEAEKEEIRKKAAAVMGMLDPNGGKQAVVIVEVVGSETNGQGSHVPSGQFFSRGSHMDN